MHCVKKGLCASYKCGYRRHWISYYVNFWKLLPNMIVKRPYTGVEWWWHLVAAVRGYVVLVKRVCHYFYCRGTGEKSKVKLKTYIYILTPIHRSGVFKQIFLFYTKGTLVLVDEHKHTVVYHCYIHLLIEILIIIIIIKEIGISYLLNNFFAWILQWI